MPTIYSEGYSAIWEMWAWGLMTGHPWFAFDSLKLSFVRPLVGYGPDLFHSTYLLVSPPDFNQLPSEFVHAHNYFVHQGVELGFLGLIASLGVFSAVVLVGGYQMFRLRKGEDMVNQLLIAGVVATVAGRLLEQMVGIARVSDLTIFWVLLAVFAALPAVMEGRQVAANPESGPRRRARRRRANPAGEINGKNGRQSQWRFIGQLVLIGFLVIGIGVLTWRKGINYVRAAVIADRAEQQLQAGNLQAALSSMDGSIDLAPDVNTYYGNRSRLYAAFIGSELLSQHDKCGGLAEPRARATCLAEEAYLSNVKWVEERPLSYLSRFSLADSALTLASLTGDINLAEEATKRYRETAEMVPTSFRAWNRLADVHIVLNQPQDALLALDKSLAILGDHTDAVTALFLQAEAFQIMGQDQRYWSRWTGPAE